MKIFDEKKKEIGFISSGGFSPTLGTSIGLGYIDINNQNEKLFCLIRNKMEEIEIIKLPFISHKYKKG
jgi:aminomethyltransferase